GRSDSEREDRADRANQGGPEAGVKLVEILMRQGEGHTELADAGEHVGEGRGAESLELVDHDMKGKSLLAAECGEVERDDQQRAEEPALADAEFALRQIDDQHLAAGEDVV